MTETPSSAATRAWIAMGSSDAKPTSGAKPASPQACLAIRYQALVGAPPIHGSPPRSESASGRRRRVRR